MDLYSKVPGMERVEFGNGLHAMHFGDHRFNIKDATTAVTPTAGTFPLDQRISAL